MKEYKKSDLGDYKLIAKYENYNLYSYKGLYKTCFLKWDVENGKVYDDYRSIGCTSYTAGSSPYISKPEGETRPRPTSWR